MFPGIKTLCLAIGLLGGMQFTWAGVVVGGTRVIYEGAKKEATLSINNPEKTNPYLIQSWVENSAATDSSKPPFLVTPPLFRLDAGQENVLRIIPTRPLPEDKESLYWLNIKSIPATEQSDQNQLLISVKTRIKLIYRPTGLANDAAVEAYKKLTFSRQGNQLRVNNPTPYYIAFFSVKVGNSGIDKAGTVAPQSSLSWTLPAGATGQVSWQAINDYGGITTTASQPL